MELKPSTVEVEKANNTYPMCAMVLKANNLFIFFCFIAMKDPYKIDNKAKKDKNGSQL